jgi:xylulokinase
MKTKLLLGYDVGSSSVKACLLNADSGECVSSDYFPKQEMVIESLHSGWAEQNPEMWWQNLVEATKSIISKVDLNNYEILAIGISYQMHGLVMVDKDLKVLHPSIIWCDSRAVKIGENAFDGLGESFCLTHLLNSPGNFTASKFKWVKENLPDVYKEVYKILLPGDYIALKLSGTLNTTIPGLSEGIMWDFNNKSVASSLLDFYEFNESIIPDIVPTFGNQSLLSSKAAIELGLTAGIPITYRAGDQPNNALSLNVLNPSEVAATAGTSGVIYGVTKDNTSDTRNRVNTFAHVNYATTNPREGVLLCINGTGIQYSWVKQNIFNNQYSYEQLNQIASQVSIGSNGLFCFPFGNGSERMLDELNIGASFSEINFNIHNKNHFARSAQEGIAFAFRYGLDVLRELGMDIKLVRAGNQNLFLSDLFKEIFVNTCNVDLEMYNTDGAQGAARGAGIGVEYYNFNSAFYGLKKIRQVKPVKTLSAEYENVYQQWKERLEQIIHNHDYQLNYTQ